MVDDCWMTKWKWLGGVIIAHCVASNGRWSLDDKVELTWQKWLSETTKNVRIIDLQVWTRILRMQNRSAELLISRSMKAPSSAHVFQAWGCDGKAHLILVKAVTALASESLIVLEFAGFRWYVPTYQCTRIASSLLSPPLVSVVIARTRRSVTIIIHSVLICESLMDSMREVWFPDTNRGISFRI